MMQKGFAVAAVVLMTLGTFLGVGIMTAPLAKANFSSAYDEPLPKKPKKPVKKQVKKPAPQTKQTVQARKKQYQLQQRRIAQANSRSRYSRSGCYSFFDCLRQKNRTYQRRSATTASVGGIDRQTRSTVPWKEAKYAPGTIIVRTPERALYYVLPDGKALRYDVGVGKEGFQWSGNAKIVMKKEWPSWRPPQQMIEREAAKGHIIPEFMEGGPDNPLGARAMYIGGTLFRIHGTNNAASIGGAVSSGCIRMMNTDVIDLYDRVKVGSRVYVYQ
jgi:lipoprotein-anchoring transpeptidase ErfK/SrfK